MGKVELLHQFGSVRDFGKVKNKVNNWESQTLNKIAVD